MQAPAAVSALDPALRISSTFETKDHNVRSFLQRAYAIDNFTWAKTSPTGTVLATYRFPDILLSQPALAAKTRNFFGLRAGVELIVLINKQQFQAGNLLISYLPNARYNPAKAAMAQTSLQTLTGMPRTNLDLMDATRATLQVPYASPFVYYNLLTGDGTIGDFYITVYSPLSDVADSGTVSVQVFARFVDVDLEFPTGSVPTTFTKTPGIDNLIEQFRVKPSFASLDSIMTEGKSILEKIKDGQFRFQMNSENHITQNMKLRALPNMAVSSDTNNAHIMSLSSSNVLPSTNMGETNSNEMNINAVMQIPCFHDSFQVSNQASGVNVFSKLVQPQVPIVPNADGSLNVDYIHFHSEPFSKWRGSIIYHFRVIKTTFHSLRVRVWFSPASLITDTIDRNAVYSKIVDLKDTNKFTFEVPFVWPHPFLNVHVKPMSLGTIGVDIVNAMVFPATVDSTINFIVERSAGTDFCLNLPTVVSAFPFNPSVIPTEARLQQTGSHHISARKGVQIPLPNPQRVSYDIVGNNNMLPSEVVVNLADKFSAFTRLPTNVREFANENSTYVTLEKVQLLDDLAMYENIQPSMFQQSSEWLKNRLSAYGMRDPTDLRKKRAIASSQWLRDLTTEGVEPNPGPIQCFTNRGSTSVTLTYTSTFSGPQSIRFLAVSTGQVTAYAFSGDITGNVLTEIGHSIAFVGNYVDTGTPSFSVVTTPSVSAIWSINVIFSSNPVASITTPLDVNATIVAPIPLPTTGGGGGGNIVATTSITPFVGLDDQGMNWRFQMNSEQDSLRTGFDDITFHRPVQSTRADSLILGQKVSDVRDMIKRSTLFGTLVSPTNAANIITIIPHMIGDVQKDDDGLLHQNACDLISYYASTYAFARGGINLRIVTAPDFYWNTILDPDSTFYTPAVSVGAVAQNAAPPSTLQRFQLNNPLQQVVKPSLEGFGEVSVPFYSDTFMYSINPAQISEPAVDNQQLQLPYSQLALVPNGAYNQFQVFRAACSDFEFSYLTGPPKLFPIST